MGPDSSLKQALKRHVLHTQLFELCLWKSTGHNKTHICTCKQGPSIARGSPERITQSCGGDTLCQVHWNGSPKDELETNCASFTGKDHRNTSPTGCARFTGMDHRRCVGDRLQQVQGWLLLRIRSYPHGDSLAVGEYRTSLAGTHAESQVAV